MAEISAAPRITGQTGRVQQHRMPPSPLKLLALITLGYVFCAVTFLLLIGGSPIDLMLRSLTAFSGFFNLARAIIPLWLVVALVGLLVGVPQIRRRLWQKRTEILLTIIYSSVLASVFGLVKNHLPEVVPFWADPLLIRIDAVTSFVGLVSWLDRFSTNVLLSFYFNGWVLIATFLPAILCITDQNETRRRTFTILWAFCWIGLGNFIAVAFMSVGPIFLDLLPGTDASDYGNVTALLQRPDASSLVMVKNHLWGAYAARDYMVGSGISAFPSVHVGMAVVVALYLAVILREQAARLSGTTTAIVLHALGWVLPVVLVLVFLVLSVYLGWHYASDGYVSILVICGVYWGLTRRKSAT